MSGFDDVCDWLGRLVVSGELPLGAAVSVDAVAATTGVARTVVREAARVVEGLGLVSPRQRVGLVAQPPSSWALLDPRVIRWRLKVGDREAQVRELAEIRLAIEPLAASLAAQRRTHEEAMHLTELAASMTVQTAPDTLICIDQDFHHTLVAAAGNGMLTQAAIPIAEALRHHTVHGAGRASSEQELGLHVSLAQAVKNQNAKAAAKVARRIIQGPPRSV